MANNKVGKNTIIPIKGGIIVITNDSSKRFI